MTNNRKLPIKYLRFLWRTGVPPERSDTRPASRSGMGPSQHRSIRWRPQSHHNLWAISRGRIGRLLLLHLDRETSRQRLHLPLRNSTKLQAQHTRRISQLLLPRLSNPRLRKQHHCHKPHHPLPPPTTLQINPESRRQSPNCVFPRPPPTRLPPNSRQHNHLQQLRRKISIRKLHPHSQSQTSKSPPTRKKQLITDSLPPSHIW